jgi:hypothetical protein
MIWSKLEGGWGRGREAPWRGGRGALGAAAARSQSVVLAGVFPVLGSRQTPPPGALCAHFGEGFAVCFFRVRLCQGFSCFRNLEVPHTVE